MDNTPQALCGTSPASALSVHLGGAPPAGTISLSELVELTFQGYTPGRFANVTQSVQQDGFTFLTGTVLFTCLDSSGFTAQSIWVVSNAGGSPALVAFASLTETPLSFNEAGTLSMSLEVMVFSVPAGWTS